MRTLKLFIVWSSMLAALSLQAAEPRQTAIFGGGCFWCVEAAFDSTDGVTDVVSGYSGGAVANPSYEQVTRGGTGHAEVVQVTYDPKKISYAKLLEIFWRNVDPFDGGGQFCDRGDSYRAEIFVGSDLERVQAEASRQSLEKRFDRPVATRISGASEFYPAEGYHQDYHRKNPVRYKLYTTGCGRAARLSEVWGPPKP